MKFKCYEIDSIRPIQRSNLGLIEIDVLMTDDQYVELLQMLCEHMGDARFLSEAKKIAE